MTSPRRDPAADGDELAEEQPPDEPVGDFRSPGQSDPGGDSDVDVSSGE